MAPKTRQTQPASHLTDGLFSATTPLEEKAKRLERERTYREELEQQIAEQRLAREKEEAEGQAHHQSRKKVDLHLGPESPARSTGEKYSFHSSPSGRPPLACRCHEERCSELLLRPHPLSGSRTAIARREIM